MKWITSRKYDAVINGTSFFPSTNIILVATSIVLKSAVKELYHTSALTGERWVLELMSGHSECIHCELGVHLHVFTELLAQLRLIKYTDSKYVSLKEQVAIFLYTCVMGQTTQHVGEWFQRSNGTILQWVHVSNIHKDVLFIIIIVIFDKYLFALSSNPFYNMYVHLPTAHDPISLKICHNSKFWPLLWMAVTSIVHL